MIRQRLRAMAGVTLLELTFAMGILAVALSVTAQGLVSYYVILDTQGRKARAVEHCTNVISAVRDVRKNAAADSFVTAITTWVDQKKSTSFSEVVTLMPTEQITVTCTNQKTGGAAADPLLVRVSSTCKDLAGRPLSVQVASVFTRDK